MVVKVYMLKWVWLFVSFNYFCIKKREFIKKVNGLLVGVLLKILFIFGCEMILVFVIKKRKLVVSLNWVLKVVEF